MSISLKTHKMLWGRSGNMCAFPECKLSLVADISQTDDLTIIGEEAHIVAQKPDGPRGDANFPIEKIDKYENLVLLCSVHHKIVDDNVDDFPKEKLIEFKKNHEDWVLSSLTVDPVKQRDDELYASYIEKIMLLSEVKNWRGWTSFLLAPTPSTNIKRVKQLRELIDYIISRVWPKRYPELEYAIYNYKSVINDLLNVFEKYSYNPDSNDAEGTLFTESFYNRASDIHQEEKLIKAFDFHVDLVQDLVLESTRAMNYIFDKVREFIFPAFRIEEGLLLVERGPMMDFRFHTHRVEYQTNEKKDTPYPGLDKFMEAREERDMSIGKGFSENYTMC